MGQCEGKLTPKTISEIHEATNYSDEEIKNWYAKFKADYPDGRVTLDQLQAVYAQMYPEGDSAAFAKEIFRVFDSNKDGFLDFKEFILAYYLTKDGSVEERIAATFKLFDVDGKGSITEAETLSVFTTYQKMIPAFGRMTIQLTPEDETENFFKALDKNQDKQITEDEFIANAKNNPMILKVLNFQIKPAPEETKEKPNGEKTNGEKTNGEKEQSEQQETKAE